MRNKASLSAVFNDLRADFRAGKDTRFMSKLSGVSSLGSGADYHYSNEVQFLHMIERARYYQRNDPLIQQGVRRLVANVVQEGFTLDVNTGDEVLDDDIKARWNDWAQDADQCHSERELTFRQQEQLVLSTMIVDGDLLALPLKTGELQFVEAHRLRTPRNTRKNVINGVLLDGKARRTEYWVTRENLQARQGLTKVSDIIKYPARDSQGKRQVNHIYSPFRFSQRRGVTALAPVAETIGIHDDIQFSTLVKTQMAAMIAIIKERDSEYRGPSDLQYGNQSTEDVSGYTRTLEEIQAGVEIAGNPGERVVGFSPNIPNPEFFPHAMMVLTFIAINLDLPVHVFLLDPSRTNFSGWRGAIDQARLRFRQLQLMLSEVFHQRTYKFKLMQFIETDAAIASAAQRGDIDIFKHRWNCPGWPYLEPMKDAAADLLQQRNALNSPRRIQAMRGREWNDIVAEIVEDNSTAIRAAKREAASINQSEGGDPVHWRELISLPTPDGVTVNIDNSESSGGADEETPELFGRQSLNGNGKH